MDSKVCHDPSEIACFTFIEKFLKNPDPLLPAAGNPHLPLQIIGFPDFSSKCPGTFCNCHHGHKNKRLKLTLLL